MFKGSATLALCTDAHGVSIQLTCFMLLSAAAGRHSLLVVGAHGCGLGHLTARHSGLRFLPLWQTRPLCLVKVVRLVLAPETARSPLSPAKVV